VAIEPGDAARDEAVTLAVDLFNERLLAVPQAEEIVQASLRAIRDGRCASGSW
jgi:hypothetical protein